MPGGTHETEDGASAAGIDKKARLLSVVAEPSGAVTLSDGRRGMLAGAKAAAFAGAHVDAPPPPPGVAPLYASMDDVLAELARREQAAVAAGDDEAGGAAAALRAQMRNTIKKCPACSKVCGYNLSACNSCGAALPDEVTHSHNVFMGFLHGVARGPFPLTVSARRQGADFLVFDDLLASTPCHLNVVPAQHYVPDWRALLARPAAGAELLRGMEAAAWAAVEEQFLACAPFCNKLLRGGTPSDAAALRHSCIAAGMNFPPSQFQLHLQYMLLPFLPAHLALFEAGHHFTPGRFFPLEYLQTVLDALADADGAAARAFAASGLSPSSSVEELVAFFGAQGVADYDGMHKAFVARVAAAHAQLANWQAADFELAVVGDGVVSLESGEDAPGAEKGAVVGADKAVLQNYGRPYDEASGRPSGTYFQHARSLDDPAPAWLDGL